MNAIKAVDIAKKVSGEVSEDILYRACERIEMMIEKYAELPHKEFNKEADLIAAGGKYDGYDDLYTIYLKREAALSIEDWDCFSSYDSLFAIKWSDLCREIVQTHNPEAQSFGDWRWT
jgi:hypothetical protein